MEQEFFTWASLGTYAGAVFATTLITQLFKGIGVISRIPTRLFSYAVALVVLLVATIVASGLEWQALALCVFNALIVSLAANGTYEAVASKKTTE